MKNIIKKIVISCIILLSFMLLFKPTDSGYSIFDYFKNELSIRGFLWIIIAILIYAFFNNTKKYDKKVNIISIIGSIIYTSLFLIGNHYNNHLECRINYITLFILFIEFAGLFLMIKKILQVIISYITNYKKQTNIVDKKSNILNSFYTKYPVLFIFCLLLLLYIPYIIIFYPGTMNMDSLFEIEQFYGKIEWTTHHPIFPTILYGLLMKIGSKIVDNNFGLFLCNIVQLLSACFVISYGINYIYKKTESKLFKIILIIFFSFFPIWCINFYSCVKDVFFSISFLLFIICFIKYHSNEKFTKLDWALLILSIIFIILFRNNGIHIMVLSLLPLFFLLDKKKRFKFLICLLLCITFCVIFNKISADIFNIKKGSVREVLSIPLQQTSTYVIKHKLTENEEKVINKIVNIKDIKNNYNPETIDYVKEKYNDEASMEDLKDYFIIWGKMFFKHPLTYISATLNSTYGYFYPNKIEFKDNIAQITIDAPESVNKSNFKINHIEEFTSVRNTFIELISYVRVAPIIGLLFNCGTYTWILIFDTLILLINNKKKILILTPLYLVLLVCIASPVNALVRYMIPIMITIPFINFWIYSEIVNEKR